MTTTSTAIECPADQTCSVDVSDIYFDETFVADPAEGWQFAGWKKRQGGLCGGSTTPCSINTAGFEGNPSLEAVLADPNINTYLEPRFAVERTTSGINLAPVAVDKLVTELEVGVPYELVEPGFGFDIAWAVAFPDLDRIYESGAEALGAPTYPEYIDVRALLQFALTKESQGPKNLLQLHLRHRYYSPTKPSICGIE